MITSLPIIQGSVIVGKGNTTRSNISAAAVVKASAGRIAKVSVVVAGSAAGSVNNVATIGGVAAANLVAVIPNTVGVYDIDMPCSAGIVVTPGTGQTVAVSYA